MAVDVTTATRLRYDGVETYLANQLDAGVTTIEFTTFLSTDGGTPIDTLVGDEYLALSILDANYRLAEIVYLTAYDAGAVVGTIERAAEGTADRTHPVDNKVVHATTVMDYVLVQDHDIDPTAHPEILTAAMAYTDSERVEHEDPVNDTHPEFAKKAGDTFTGPVIFDGEVTFNNDVTVSAGSVLTVEGDLSITGRLFLNGYEITASNGRPASPSANQIHFQTFG
jgi:hypothetical protein